VDGTALTLTSEGSIEVLWCNDDSAKPGLIRLGGGGGGGGLRPIAVRFRAELPITGVAAGQIAYTTEETLHGVLANKAFIFIPNAIGTTWEDFWFCITHSLGVEDIPK